MERWGLTQICISSVSAQSLTYRTFLCQVENLLDIQEQEASFVTLSDFWTSCYCLIVYWVGCDR